MVGSKTEERVSKSSEKHRRTHNCAEDCPDCAKAKKKWSRREEGTVIRASDRQYTVTAAGNWRRMTKREESVVADAWLKERGYAPKFESPGVSMHVSGRRTSDGAKCWCNDCLRERRAKMQR